MSACVSRNLCYLNAFWGNWKDAVAFAELKLFGKSCSSYAEYAFFFFSVCLLLRETQQVLCLAIANSGLIASQPFTFHSGRKVAILRGDLRGEPGGRREDGG